MTRKEDFSYLTKNKIKNGVITTIRLFGSLKLKKISELLGKAESAVILHLKDLEEIGYSLLNPFSDLKTMAYFPIASLTLSVMLQIKWIPSVVYLERLGRTVSNDPEISDGKAATPKAR